MRTTTRSRRNARARGRRVARLRRRAAAHTGRHRATVAADDWRDREKLGEIYLTAARYAYSAARARRRVKNFAERVGAAERSCMCRTWPGQDVLGDSDAFAEHEGGFLPPPPRSAGKAPRLSSRRHATRKSWRGTNAGGRTGAGRARARRANPRWLEGQMRHGFEARRKSPRAWSNLFAFAAATPVVDDAHVRPRCSTPPAATSEGARLLVEANPRRRATP